MVWIFDNIWIFTVIFTYITGSFYGSRLIFFASPMDWISSCSASKCRFFRAVGTSTNPKRHGRSWSKRRPAHRWWNQRTKRVWFSISMFAYQMLFLIVYIHLPQRANWPKKPNASTGSKLILSSGSQTYLAKKKNDLMWSGKRSCDISCLMIFFWLPGKGAIQ